MGRSKKLSDDEWERVPSTLQRSPEKAQETFTETLESAEQVRGHEGDQQYAHRVAFAAVKHQFEKVGDHWEQKAAKGPSDEQAARGPAQGSQRQQHATAGGVDANASKKHLMDLARRLDVKGRSTMTKEELVAAIGKANDRATARARNS